MGLTAANQTTNRPHNLVRTIASFFTTEGTENTEVGKEERVRTGLNQPPTFPAP
jgi:hypothetical protein